MYGIRRNAVFVVAGFALTISTSGPGVQFATAQAPDRTAEEIYKNIQVLKGVPAQLVLPTMNYFETSLGVSCDFCHDEHFRELDTKETKQVTRKMIQMVFAIDKDFYGGSQVVTCFTCHRGKVEPIGLPLLSTQERQPSASETLAQEADQLVDKYIAALGGADAIRKISSRILKGSVTDALGRKFPLEIYTKPPAKRLLLVTPLGKGVSTAGARSHQEADYLADGVMNGATILGYNGDVGWISFRANHPDNMRMNELDAARLEDPLFFAGQMRQVFSKLRFDRTEMIGDRAANVISGSMGSLPEVRLFFDKDSGMLVRLVYFTETLVGRFPTQIDYADFRTVEGVKLPFRWTIDLIRGRHFTYQIEQAQQNVPIEESKFTKYGAPLSPK